MIVGYLFFLRSLYVLEIVGIKTIYYISDTTAIRYIFSFHKTDMLEEADTPQPAAHGSDGRME